MAEDIRWKQRLGNYAKALGQLSKFIEKGELNELERQGLIQSFAYTYELAWNVIKDFFEHQGQTDILGSRDAFRLAFKRGLVEQGDIWMDMIKSRILTSHSYNEELAAEVALQITERYYPEFVKLHAKLARLSQQP